MEHADSHNFPAVTNYCFQAPNKHCSVAKSIYTQYETISGPW
jgi:hypothetical protein